eukprot:428597-Pyramimonas_sp.AAC.1
MRGGKAARKVATIRLRRRLMCWDAYVCLRDDGAHLRLTERVLAAAMRRLWRTCLTRAQTSTQPTTT